MHLTQHNVFDFWNASSAVLPQETSNMITKKELAKMQKGSYLLNAARGWEKFAPHRSLSSHC